MKRCAALLFCGLAAIACPAAEEKAAPLEETRLHLTGLFAPDREADLRAALEELPEVQVVSVDFGYSEATFRFNPAQAFPGAKPADILKRFDEKLRQASSGTFSAQPLGTTPREKLSRLEIPVVGLDCRACSLAAYEAVAKLDGVVQATASFREGRVTVLIDPEKTDRAKLEAALKTRRVQVRQP